MLLFGLTFIFKWLAYERTEKSTNKTIIIGPCITCLNVPEINKVISAEAKLKLMLPACLLQNWKIDFGWYVKERKCVCVCVFKMRACKKKRKTNRQTERQRKRWFTYMYFITKTKVKKTIKIFYKSKQEIVNMQIRKQRALEIMNEIKRDIKWNKTGLRLVLRLL